MTAAILSHPFIDQTETVLSEFLQIESKRHATDTTEAAACDDTETLRDVIKWQSLAMRILSFSPTQVHVIRLQLYIACVMLEMTSPVSADLHGALEGIMATLIPRA